MKAFDNKAHYYKKFEKALHGKFMTHITMHGAWVNLIFRVNIIIIVLLAASLSMMIIYRFSINPILVGMILNNVQGLFGQILGIMFCFGGYQGQKAKIQQCLNLLEIPQEQEKIEKKESWPKRGTVTFDNVHLRYRPKTDLVLKGLNFEIQGGQKVGVVGRTGAGKSTMSLALTRIIELETGSISIDGVDIAEVPINKLRSKITIIPQDPTMFTGSLRMNIDPCKKSSDEEIISLLKKAGLDSLISQKEKKEGEEQTFGLNYQVEENGKNLSSGEKQLICICRAILRKNKVIILDEATANIDLNTEQKIQALIKEEFAECTVITIAHRLQTIIESDQILMLSEGTVQEFGSPEELMQDRDSRFNQLIADLKNNNH